MTWQELAASVPEATKAAPPVAVGAMTFCGVQLSDFVLGLTAVYTAFQLYFLLRDKWWRQRGKRHKK